MSQGRLDHACGIRGVPQYLLVVILSCAIIPIVF